MRSAVVVLALLSNAAHAQAPAGAGRVEGIVLDGNDQPLHAAKVWIEHGGDRIATTTADAQGWFVVGRMPLVDLVVRTSVPGRAGVAVVRPSAVGRTAFACLSTFPTRRLEVVVRDAEGAPVTGADVMAASNGPGALPWATSRSTTDAEGRCTLADVIIGSADVFARHTEVMGKVTVDGADDLAVDVSLPAKSERRVHLRLRDATAEQIAAARVVLRCEEKDDVQLLPLPAGGVAFAADGTATIPWLPMGLRLRIAVRCEGCWFAPRSDFVPPFQRDAQMGFRPAPPVVVRATLQDRMGAPVVGAAVVLRPYAGGFDPYPAVVATTGADGSLAAAMPLVPGDNYNLRLPSYLAFFDPDRAPWESDPCAMVVKHGSEPTQALRVAPCVPFEGTIRDRRGAPAPGVEVTVVHHDSLVASSETARDGTFRIALPYYVRDSAADSLQLIARGAAGEVKAAVVLGRDGVASVTAVLEGANVATGRALDPGGKPAAGARVFLEPNHGPGGAAELARSQLWTVAERDGTFRFAGHGAGAYTVRCGDSSQRLELPTGESSLPDVVRDR